MIVLDTNVVSELMTERPDAPVVRWFGTQPSESIWTTAVTIFESWFGIELLAHGRRRRGLEAAFERGLGLILEHRVLPFDETAARQAGTLAAAAHRTGRPFEIRDVQIAAIASVRRATLATRNVRHFEHLGIRMVDPWSAP